MKSFFKKPFLWASAFSIILAGAVTFTMLDTFVIEKVGTPVVSTTPSANSSVSTLSNTSSSSGSSSSNSSSGSSASSSSLSSSDSSSSDSSSGSSSDSSTSSSSGSTTTTSSTGSSASTTSATVVTATSYKDDNIQITIETIRQYDTTIYIADIQVSDVSYLKTALAKNTYGRNIKQTTSVMAEAHNAIFAINGDYYGFRDSGYVLRNGVLYRDDASSDDALAIDSLGNFSIVDQSQTTAQSLDAANMWQVFSFGPALINNGVIAVTSSSEVDQSMTSNPRTAIGQVSALHYIVVVSDGRTTESVGLSLLELAQVFYDRNCTVAYNLDGGGSSTMWFNGQVINNPTDGHTSGERSVSDIVYFGYE